MALGVVRVNTRSDGRCSRQEANNVRRIVGLRKGVLNGVHYVEQRKLRIRLKVVIPVVSRVRYGDPVHANRSSKPRQRSIAGSGLRPGPNIALVRSGMSGRQQMMLLMCS